MCGCAHNLQAQCNPFPGERNQPSWQVYCLLLLANATPRGMIGGTWDTPNQGCQTRRASMLPRKSWVFAALAGVVLLAGSVRADLTESLKRGTPGIKSA